MKRILLGILALILLISTSAFAADWTGQILRTKDGKLSFVSGGKTYNITNPAKAQGFEGKNVKVTGVSDQATKAITLTAVSKA